ncbi:MAG: hypothetical protein HYV51_02495 [Parcubacteria group bacterium]|nr:hypothetical protein [Parcubacteria group bacterium]
MKKSAPTIDVLFDSPVRVRVLKLFLYNPETSFESQTISKILNIGSAIANKHLRGLKEVKLIDQKMIKSKKVFKTNPDFYFYNELKELILKANPASKEKLIKRISSLGKIRIAIISGIFVNFDGARADLMIVGDDVKPAKFNKFLKDLEAEVGKEINCALMTVKEFNYRYNMYDRFVRDLLDFKHEKLINKLKI